MLTTNIKTVCLEMAAQELALSSLPALCAASQNATLIQDVEACLITNCSPADTLGRIVLLTYSWLNIY